MLERRLGWLEAGVEPFRQERGWSSQSPSSPLIGYHASHELFPERAAGLLVAAERAGFPGRCARTTSHPGPSGRAGAASPGPGSARRCRPPAAPSACLRAGAALPPGDRGAGGRHAGRDVPGPVLAGRRQRPEPPTSTSPATPGPPRTSDGRAKRGGGRHPPPVGRRGGPPRGAGPGPKDEALHPDRAPPALSARR